MFYLYTVEAHKNKKIQFSKCLSQIFFKVSENHKTNHHPLLYFLLLPPKESTKEKSPLYEIH